MEPEDGFDNSLYSVQETMGCPKCLHCKIEMLGFSKENFCPEGMTDIGPMSLKCREFLDRHITGKIRVEYDKMVKVILAASIVVTLISGCSKNPTEPNIQPTQKPTAAQTFTMTPTIIPAATEADTTTATPTPSITTTSTPVSTPTATTIPTTKHLKYYLSTTCSTGAQVYLNLPVGNPTYINVWPGNPQTYETDVPLATNITVPVWSFTGPVSPYSFTMEIWIEGVVFYNATKNF